MLDAYCFLFSASIKHQESSIIGIFEIVCFILIDSEDQEITGWMKKIVVTGIGVISSMGVGRDDFWEGCLTARSGLKRIDAFDTQAFRSNVAGCVEGFKPADYMPPMVYRRMSRISRMAVASSIEALEDSRLALEDTDRERVAVIMGTSYGSSSHVDAFYLSLLKDGPRGAQPMLFPETVPNAPASHIAIYHKISGPNITFCQNEISAETALDYAANLLENDVVDVAIVGGAEELSEIIFGCYDAVGALSRIRFNEGEPVEPVSADGLILGEGAATLILERTEFAEKRDARVYGFQNSVVIAGGDTAMGHYEKSGEQMAGALCQSLEKAGIKNSDVDHISISSNFSRELDAIEHEQIGRLFRNNRPDIRVTPLKYLTGDFGAAGITRAAAILMSLHHQQPLPSLPIDALLPGTHPLPEWEVRAPAAIQYALMTSTTFGGGSCSMVFSAA
jgi:3-oxoacyl-[acyl-carrier-protein] synthase II